MKLPFYQVAYMYPPINSVGVLRNAEITKMLVSKGHKGIVVTSTHTPITESASDSFDIVRVNVLDYRSRKGPKANFSPSQSVKESIPYKIFTKLNNNYPFNLILGEGAVYYIYCAYKELDKQIAKVNGKGILVSSFRPWADHQIAYLLKKKYPKLIWWCDWRDTAFENRKSKPIAIKYQQKKLHQLIANADSITAVSAGVLHDLQPLNNFNEVLYNGATNDIQSSDQEKKTDMPSVSYTGSLYGEDRNPRPLFVALSELLKSGLLTSDDFEITYAGKDSSKWKSMIDDVNSNLPAKSLGLISQAEAMSIQKRAAINVLLTWSNPGQTGGLTMKVFEYLRAGQPILRIHDGPKDPEIDEVLAKAGASVFTQQTRDTEFNELKVWIVEQLKNYSIKPIKAGFDLADNLSTYYENTLSSKFNLT